MTTIRLQHTIPRLAEAMRRAPGVILDDIDNLLERQSIEGARDAKSNAPKSLSGLVNSIRNQRIGLASHDIISGAGYSAAVEEGSKGGGFAPIEALRRWIRVAGITPRTPGVSEAGLAFLIQRKIFRSGSKAQPFMQPAADTTAERLRRLLPGVTERAVERALLP